MSRKARKGIYENPRLDPSLKKSFSKIGVPEFAPFKPDAFQLEALTKIKESDVVVSAPTGTGKTWIASKAIEECLNAGLRVWYASPLKALSNSLYQEFSREFGPDCCGILTGEIKENPDAPLVVGTTEILRNQLYDAMHKGSDIKTDLVILDEAHYLSDPDRGVVWEEVLIYLPSRVRILLLSATVSNAEEVASWLEGNRKTRMHVVRSYDRPVSLDMLFLFPDGLISPLGGSKGLVPKVKKFVLSREAHGRRGQVKPQFGEIIRCLRKFDLLPAIFFLKSRRDCDSALFSCFPSDKSKELKKEMNDDIKAFTSEYPHLEGHRHMPVLKDSLVASHHAGQLPHWKILVERMMNKGYLEAIFSTSTVAAGVNFPARTVVILQSDRYNGYEFANLTSTEFHQMVGRAGRRGMDNIGFAMVIPGIHQDPKLIHELVDSAPEPLVSQIKINFSMTLNLLLSHSPLEVKALLDLSFAAFQQRMYRSPDRKRWDGTLRQLNEILSESKCDTSDPFEVLDNIRRMSRLKRELKNIHTGSITKLQLKHLKTYLVPGRLFHHKKDGVYLLFYTYTDHGRLMCAAHNLEKTVRFKKGKIRLRRIPFSKIKWLYDYTVDLPQEYSMEALQEMADSIKPAELEVLQMDIPGQKDAIRNIQEQIDKLPCDQCTHTKDCHSGRNKELNRAIRDFRNMANSIEGMSHGLWINFKRHLRFLKETGFVSEDDCLTPDGIWASRLRLDQPLLIAEAIRQNVFNGLSPESLAGCIAPFVWDRDQEPELKMVERIDINLLNNNFSNMLGSLENIISLKVDRGFESPEIQFWPAVVLYLWARGMAWDQLLLHVPIEEGDMVSLIVRTADHLRQIANLKDTHPELASAAASSVPLILREPVYIE